MQTINSSRQIKKLSQRFLIGIVASSAGAFIALPGTAKPEASEAMTEVSEATEIPVGVIVEPTAAETLPTTGADALLADPVAETETLEEAPVVEADEVTEEEPTADTETSAEEPVADTETPAEEPVAEEPTPETEAAEGIDTENYTITELTGNSDSFDILTAALAEAGLTEELSGAGPFTIFAPTDEAFEALPDGLVDQLMLPENKAVLRQILAYHVVPGEVLSTDLETGSITTVEGEDIEVTAGDTVTTVNDANVILADVAASNGIIHVIDSVMVPPEPEAGADTDIPAPDQ